MYWKFLIIPVVFLVAIGVLFSGHNGIGGNALVSGDDMTTYALIETSKGAIRAELYTKEVPLTTQNFIQLAESGFYKGLSFHRYVPDFVIQGGDPKGDGTGGSDKTIPLEIRGDLKHVEGVLGMARARDPNSASSQFYITLKEQPDLDGQYAVFGIVKEGMNIVRELRANDTIIDIKIEKK